MSYLLFKNPKRGCDDYGCGHYGASRGKRKHKGVDILAMAGSVCCTHIEGVVTKLGYPYKDDLSYRYVQIKAPNGLLFDFFYVDPSVSVGDKVEWGDEIGTVQDLGVRYPGIPDHVHFQVRKDGRKINPEPYL